MKKIILLSILGGLSWWYFIGDRKLTEEHVARYYEVQTAATLGRDPDKLCAQLANEYKSKISWIVDGKKIEQSRNKEQTCENSETVYRDFEALGEKMGGILHLDYSHEIQDIRFSPDRKTATVDISFTLKVGGSLITYTGHGTDTLIRKRGRTLLLHSEGAGKVSGAS